MNKQRKKHIRNLTFIWFFLAIIIAGISYLLFPNWLTSIASGIILASLAADKSLDILDRLSGALSLSDRFTSPKLFESVPIRQINYEMLIARLGRSGKIPWINRTALTAGLLRREGRVAVIGWMKSGKTREAAELIRLATTEETINIIYEPTSSIDLLDEDELAKLITSEFDARHRVLFFIDELGLRPEPERLNRLTICIETITHLRLDSYFLITIQRERLSPIFEEWLELHSFYQHELPPLSMEQRKDFAETSAHILNVDITRDVVDALAEGTDGKPYSIIFALQRAIQNRSLNKASITKLLSIGDEEAWAEQRRQVILSVPTAGILLDSIITFVSAGITPRKATIERYAIYLLKPELPLREAKKHIRLAADRWSIFDIVSTSGLYTIPEPLLVPLLVERREAHDRIELFLDEYKSPFIESIFLKLISPLELYLKINERIIRKKITRRILKPPVKLTVWVRGFTVRVNYFKNRLSLSLSQKTNLYPVSLFLKMVTIFIRLLWKLITFPFKFLVRIYTKLLILIQDTMFSWPVEQALLLLELENPQNPEYVSSTIMLNRGKKAYQSGNFEVGLNYFNRCIALNPKNVQAFIWRGDTYQNLEDHKQALHDYTSAIELDPTSFSAYTKRGILHTERGNFNFAMADLTMAIELNHNYEPAYHSLGNLHAVQGNYNLALADLTRVVELDPTFALGYLRRGVAHYMLGHINLALVDFTRSIELAPKFAFAYNNRGFTYMGQGDYDLALADLTRAVELGFADEVVYYNQSIIHFEQGNYNLALADFTKAIEFDSNYDKPYHPSHIHIKRQSHKLALADLTAADKPHVVYLLAYFNRGLYHFDQTFYILALADFTKVIEIDPAYVIAYNNRGVIHSKHKNYDLALADYNKAIELDPNNDSPVYNKACAYALLNNSEEACKLLRRACEMSEDNINIAIEDTAFDKIKYNPCFQSIFEEFGDPDLKNGHN